MINLFAKYWTIGGTVWRILFTNSKEELKYLTDKLNILDFGVHWFYSYDDIDFAANGLKMEIERKTKKTYSQEWLVKAYVAPRQVNIMKSLEAFFTISEEGEIFINSPAEFLEYEIIPYKVNTSYDEPKRTKRSN